MRWGMTGTREGVTPKQLGMGLWLLDALGADEWHHGDCVGADAAWHGFLRQNFPEVVIHVHPPKNDSYRAWKSLDADIIYSPDDYISRNQHIVRITDVLIAFPKSTQEELRSGTWSTVRFARKLKKPHAIIYPDGVMLLTHFDSFDSFADGVYNTVTT